MDFPELDALAAELHARLQREGFRGLSSVTIYDGQTMEANLIARIVLADIEHIREWDRTHPTQPTGTRRLRAVDKEAHRLLRLDADERDAAAKQSR